MFLLLLFSAGTPCLCVDSHVGQEDEKGLLDTEDSRHRTCTKIPVVNFGTLPGKIHTLLHFLGAGNGKKKLLIPFGIFLHPKHNCL